MVQRVAWILWALGPMGAGVTMAAQGQGATPSESVSFPRGRPAHIVAAPRTPLEKRIVARLATYLERVTGRSAQVVRSTAAVPPGEPAFVVAGPRVRAPFAMAVPAGPDEAFALATGRSRGRPLVVAVGATDRGLKRAVQRLILRSRQDAEALVIPALRVSEAPWIPRREWTACPWQPHLVRGVFHNPQADPRLNIYLYDDRRLADYVEMLDWLGYSGGQLMETCYTFAVFGSVEAAHQWQKRVAALLRENGQEVTLWAWAAQFTGFGWADPEVTYTPAPGKPALDDPEVRRTFEKYYDAYADLAPQVDRFVGHFFDPGQLEKRSDVFQAMRLLEAKLRARNPRIQMGIDCWAAGTDYLLELASAGFSDYLLLPVSFPELYPPGRREALHEEARRLGLRLGIWGWYTAEYETDQIASMYVNAKVLKEVYSAMRRGALRLRPVEYWSEMEAHHLNNLATVYAAGQLLWNPHRDPDELLAEVTDAVWGPRNGPAVLRALHLIQDVRSGPTWETYWWTRAGHRIGTKDAADDLRRAEEVLGSLRAMKPDPAYVPKVPLPYPPEVLVTLMLPHVEQIRRFAEFRVKVGRLREAASRGASRETLEAMLVDAWQPVPEFSTWVGTFGSPELRAQKAIVGALCAEYGLQVKDPEWLRVLEADRVLQVLRTWQRATAGPFRFTPQSAVGEFLWPEACARDRFQKLVADGAVRLVSGNTYELDGWWNWAPVTADR